MKCHICTYWTPNEGCQHYSPEKGTEGYLIHLFTMDGKPYILKYGIRGHARESWKRDLPLLHKLIKEQKVVIVDRNNKSVLYRYIAEPISGN